MRKVLEGGVSRLGPEDFIGTASGRGGKERNMKGGRSFSAEEITWKQYTAQTIWALKLFPNLSLFLGEPKPR